MAQGYKSTGPLFDGRAKAAVEDFLIEAGEQVAKVGENDVRSMLGSVLQNPTGNYERHIQTDRQQNDHLVNDSQIVYGPWLEGVSSRNQSTRFKGYFTFRKVKQGLDAKVISIVDSTIRRYMDRMN